VKKLDHSWFLRLVDPSKLDRLASRRSILRGEVNRPQFLGLSIFPQLYAVTQVALNPVDDEKRMSNILKCPLCVQVNHRWSEIVIRLLDELGRSLFITEGQSVLTGPFDHTKQCQIKHLKDMRCMRCEHHDANPCAGKEFDCRQIEA
jgi:hypothetical protein